MQAHLVAGGPLCASNIDECAQTLLQPQSQQQTLGELECVDLLACADDSGVGVPVCECIESLK